MGKKEKTDLIVSEKRLKCHIFGPSGRKIWTIVGMGKEYWLAPELGFCSCEGYYFGKPKGKSCYHLESLEQAHKENNIETILFSDEEYSDFVSSLISEF